MSASEPSVPEATAGVDQHFLEPADGHGWSWSTRRRPERADEEPDGYRAADDVDAPVYVISVAADLADLHPQTLRAYEREGLLAPARTGGGTRRYSRRDVERLRFIRTLTQDEGLNLAGVRVVLDLGEKLEASRRRVGELEEMVRALAERVEERPAGERFEIVKAPPSSVEAHQHRRRTAQRPPARGGPGRRAGDAPRAQPVAPPEVQPVEG